MPKVKNHASLSVILTMIKDLHADLDGRLQNCPALLAAPGTQVTLGVIAEISAMSTKLDEMQKLLKDELIAHLKAGKPIQAGPLIATLQTIERRQPKWKEEAIKQAAALAKKRGRKFNIEKFEASVAKKAKLCVAHSTKVLPKEK